jgi:hypothetical protein
MYKFFFKRFFDFGIALILIQSYLIEENTVLKTNLGIKKTDFVFIFVVVLFLIRELMS